MLGSLNIIYSLIVFADLEEIHWEIQNDCTHVSNVYAY